MRDAVSIADPSHIQNIPVDNAPHVLPVPLARASRGAGQGFRVSTGHQPLREIVQVRQLSSGAQSGGDRSSQEVGEE